MPALAAKANAPETTQHKQKAEQKTTRAAAPHAAIAPLFSAPMIQRKAACACGGDCPRCQTAALQPKLTISQPGDRHEQEADRLAEQVMRMPLPESNFGLPTSQSGEIVQRQCGACAAAPTDSQPESDAAPLQRKEQHEATPLASPDTADRITALRGGGHALPASLRDFFEPRFGRDFGDVRIHTDGAAAETAGAVDARAYTLGHDVVFGAGQYQPDTAAGRHLLAHELAHVIQQSRGTLSSTAPQLMRARCGHDGKESGCGVNFGFLKFPDENWIIDRNLVRLMGVAFGGKWIAELPTPANPVKSGKDSGRADGVKVSDSGGALTLEIVEVKSRVIGDKTKPTGGCEKATSEAKGYVSVLEKLAPKVQTLSEKIAAKYPNHGFRLDGHDKPQGKVEREIFTGLGIDIDNEAWLQAWTVYNFIQRNWPKVFTKAFSSVTVKLNADGNTAFPYDALDYPIDCSKKGGKKPQGKGQLSFMVNKEGGVSYGCEESCEEEEDKRKRQVKPKEEQLPQDKKKPGIKDIDPTFHYIFRDGKVKPLPDSLPELPPEQFFIVAVTKLLYEAVKGAEKIQNFLKMVELRVPEWLVYMNTAAVILLTAEVAGLVAAGGVIAAELAAAGAATAAVASTVATTTTATATTTTATLLPILSTVAANDNAIAIAAAAAAFILALNSTSSEKESKAIAEAALSNKKVLAAQEATQYPDLQKVGAEMKVDGKEYRVIIVAKS
jgi:hypothetical protein